MQHISCIMYLNQCNINGLYKINTVMYLYVFSQTCEWSLYMGFFIIIPVPLNVKKNDLKFIILLSPNILVYFQTDFPFLKHWLPSLLARVFGPICSPKTLSRSGAKWTENPWIAKMIESRLEQALSAHSKYM